MDLWLVAILKSNFLSWLFVNQEKVRVLRLVFVGVSCSCLEFKGIFPVRFWL